MVGPALDSLGGMASVAATYRDAGLFERCAVRYLASYRRPNWPDKLLQLARAMLALAWLLMRQRVALLHVHSASRGSFWRKSLFVGLALLFRVPVVLHVHGGEFKQFYGAECSGWQRSLVRRVMRASACVLCLTPRWRQTLADIEPDADIRVLPNPVMSQPGILAQRAAGSVEPGCVLFLGRLREEKGVFDLLRAWPAVRAHAPRARLVLAGDGDEKSIVELASTLGVSDSVVLPGWITGAAKLEWLARAEVFVLPSYAEGLPVALLEAIVCGIPVLATRVGGVPELLDDGRLGLLIDAGDVAALQASLIQLLTDGGKCRKLAAAALACTSRDFNAAKVINQLEALWCESIDGGAR